MINIFITQSPYVKNSSRMAAVFLCLQCSYYLLLYHAKIISYILKRMFLTRNTHFDYIYLYTFKTSYRTRLNFFNQLYLLRKAYIRNSLAPLVSSSCHLLRKSSASSICIQSNKFSCLHLMILPAFLSFLVKPSND